VGATYALGKDRGTLLRASYARFADRLGLEATTISSFPGSDPGTAMLYYYWTDADGNRRVEPEEIDFESGLVDAKNVDPDNPASYFPINEISPALMPPRTDEVIVAVERQISTVLSASLAYTHRSLTNPEFSPLIGTTRASYHYLGNAAGTAVDERTGFGLDFSEPYYGLLECPDPCVGVSLQNRPDAREAYDGVELEIVKRFSHGWMLRVGAAYNNWRQRIGPSAIVDPNNITPGVNASGAIVDSGINATWQFNVSGMVELPLGIRAGLNFFGRQGFPIPYFVDTEISWDPYWYAVPQLQIGRADDYRTPDVYLLDLQVARDLLIGSRVTVGPVLACFNVLNSRTVLARNGFVGKYDTQTSAFEPAEQFNTVTETMSGRTFRVGVRVSF
jgi:hypothetical protein